MKRFSLIPEPVFSSLQYPDKPPENGIILTSKLMKLIGISTIRDLVSKLEIDDIKFQEAEGENMKVITSIKGDQIWLVRSKYNETAVLTLMLASEF